MSQSFLKAPFVFNAGKCKGDDGVMVPCDASSFIAPMAHFLTENSGKIESVTGKAVSELCKPGVQRQVGCFGSFNIVPKPWKWPHVTVCGGDHPALEKGYVRIVEAGFHNTVY